VVLPFSKFYFHSYDPTGPLFQLLSFPAPAFSFLSLRWVGLDSEFAFGGSRVAFAIGSCFSRSMRWITVVVSRVSLSIPASILRVSFAVVFVFVICLCHSSPHSFVDSVAFLDRSRLCCCLRPPPPSFDSRVVWHECLGFAFGFHKELRLGFLSSFGHPASRDAGSPGRVEVSSSNFNEIKMRVPIFDSE
jgi:hypothetical protein